MMKNFNQFIDPQIEHTFERLERDITKKRRAILTCFNDIQSKPISWLWPERIAHGKITLIAGDPGLGKSLLTATLAAIVSKGYGWPSSEAESPIADVVILSAEDDPEDTIKPRLEAAGADCGRVHILKAIQEYDDAGKQIQRMFSLKGDMKILEEMLPTLPECRLLVIDPISAYLDSTHSHNNAEVRGLLAPLAELAARCGIAIVAIQHLNKGGEANALYRPMGSLAFIAAARAGFIVARDNLSSTHLLNIFGMI